MSFPARSIIDPHVLRTFIAPSASVPATNRLSICTGIVNLDFQAAGDQPPLIDSLEFAVPDEDGRPLRVGGKVIDLLATVFLAGIEADGSNIALWAVNQVDTLLSDPDLGQVRLKIAIAIKGHATQVHLRRLTYQLTLLERLPN